MTPFIAIYKWVFNFVKAKISVLTYCRLCLWVIHIYLSGLLIPTLPFALIPLTPNLTTVLGIIILRDDNNKAIATAHICWVPVTFLKQSLYVMSFSSLSNTMSVPQTRKPGLGEIDSNLPVSQSSEWVYKGHWFLKQKADQFSMRAICTLSFSALHILYWGWGIKSPLENNSAVGGKTNWKM